MVICVVACASSYGEVALAWTGNAAWSFSRNFTVSWDDLQQQHIHLLLDGLDTVADIFINGQNAGHTKNAFRHVL